MADVTEVGNEHCVIKEGISCRNLNQVHEIKNVYRRQGTLLFILYGIACLVILSSDKYAMC